MTKTWEMNANQKAFLEALKSMGGKATLLDLKLAGKGDFKTGAINTLKTKGYVTNDNEVEYTCDVVYNGNVVGKVTKTYKVYELVNRE